MVTENIPANLGANIRITLSGFFSTMKQMIAHLTRISKKSKLILFLFLVTSVWSCKTNQVAETEPQTEKDSLLTEEDEDLLEIVAFDDDARQVPKQW